jgi:hypothetical protein
VQPNPHADQQPSPQRRLRGECLCGAVRFEVTEPFLTAGYCHCSHCQRRTGTGSSANGRLRREALHILQGHEQLTDYRPSAQWKPKVFCARCGSALFGGDRFADEEVVVRLGSLDTDPGIRPRFHAFVASAAPWEPLPDDGLPRYPRSPSDAAAGAGRT